MKIYKEVRDKNTCLRKQNCSEYFMGLVQGTNIPIGFDWRITYKAVSWHFLNVTRDIYKEVSLGNDKIALSKNTYQADYLHIVLRDYWLEEVQNTRLQQN